MAAKTEWKIEQNADTTHNEYLAALAEKGVLDEFETTCALEEQGAVPPTEEVQSFLARARAACQQK
jgi:hypothetical protein